MFICFVLFCFNDSTYRFLPEPGTLTIPENLFPLLHARHKSSFENFKFCFHFTGPHISCLFCPIFLGLTNILVIDYLSEVFKSQLPNSFESWFLSARLMSDSWLTPILNVGIFLDILVIYYHFSSTPTCVGHLASGLEHTVEDFSCSHTVFQLLMSAAILRDHFHQTMRNPDCLQNFLVT